MPDFWISLKERGEDILNFISFYVNTLIPGYFTILDKHDCRYGNSYLSLKYHQHLELLAGVFLERVPIYLKEGNEVDHYEYRQVLKIFKFINIDIDRAYSEYLFRYREKIKKDPYKGVPFQEISARTLFVKNDLNYNENYFYKLNEGRGSKIYTPTKTDIVFLDNNVPVYCPVDVRIADMAIHDQRVQVSDDAKFIMDLESNQEMVLSFFEKLEEIGIKFSDDQRKMLTSTQNTMVLGRSGTGKTTISAFKIIALDLLFMAYKKRFIHNKNTFRLTLEDFKEMSGCFTVFCTAAPVLTNEVKKFYAELIDKIKKYLRARENKARLRKLMKEEKQEIKKEVKDIEKEDIRKKDKEEEDKKESNDKDDDSFNAFDHDDEINQQPEQVNFKDDLVDSLRKEKQELLEDLELEKQLTLYSTLRSIPKTEFPLFLTVKKLVYMLDGD